jgi:enediyne biosynthesis protein E4
MKRKEYVSIQNRRRSLSRTALVLPFEGILAIAQPPQQVKLPGPIERTYDAKARPAEKGPRSPIEGTPLGVSFVDIVTESGLNVKTIYGGEHKNKFLLETTGCGLAFDDYDNDGNEDLFVTYSGQNVLYRNNGNGIFSDATEAAKLMQPCPKRAGTRVAPLSITTATVIYDLFVANYVDFDLKTAPPPEAGPCTYKGLLVACRWPVGRTFCTTTTATARSPTSARRLEFGTHAAPMG